MSFKSLIFAALAFTSLSSQAAFLSPIYRYILDSGRVVMLQGVNESRGTAWFYDYNLGQRVQVNLSEASKETNKKVNGIRVDDYIATTTVTGPQICKTYYVFENGMAQVGCRTGKYVSNIGPTRYEVASFTGSTKNLLAPVKEVDGFSLGEVALLQGRKVRVKAIFENSMVLVESANIFDKLDTSSLLLKTSVDITTTRDLEKL